MKKLSFLVAAMLMAATAQAQIKVGSNPTTIGANSNLETEATDGTKTVIQKDNGNLLIGTTIHDADAKLQVTSKAPKITPRVNHSIFQSLNATAPSQLFIHQGHNGSSPYFNFQSVEATVGNVPLSLQADGGNVGIGTTTPIAKLNVKDGFTWLERSVDQEWHQLYLSNLNTGALAQTGISFHQTSTTGTDKYSGSINLKRAADDLTKSSMSFNVRSGDDVRVAMTILGTDAVGNANVGIGTTTPLTILHAVGNGILLDRFGAGAHFQGRFANGTVAAPTAAVAENVLAKYSGSGYNGSGYNNAASMQIIATETQTATNHGQGLSFSTTLNGSTATTGYKERMRIDHNGNVGIGTTMPVFKLEVEDDKNDALVASIYNKSVGASARQMLKLGTLAKSGFMSYQNENTNFGAGFEAFGANTLTIGTNNEATGGLNLVNGGNAPIRFFIAPTGSAGSFAAADERMRIAANGNVGIGTTTPTGIVDIRRDVDATTELYVQNKNTGANANARVEVVGDASYGGLQQYSSTATDPNALRIFNSSNANLHLATNFLNRLTVTGAGNVGIGTTTPMGKLDVVDANNINRISIKGDFNFNYSPSNNHFGTNVYYDGSAFKVIDAAKPVAQIATNINGEIVFQTQMASGTFAPTPKLVMSPNGNLGIGEGMYGSHPLHMLSGAHVTTAGVWTNASDARLKANIKNSTYGLAEVMKLRPVSYTMRKGGEAQVGFIAQEVQKVIPEVVSGKEGDVAKGETLGISYGNMVAVLTKAMQEQQAEIEALKAKNGKLTAQVSELETLKAEVASIKAMLAEKSETTKAAGK
jgi:hypothetical protein